MVLPSNSSNKPKGRKLGGTLLALGTAAVVSVYTIGYVQTQPSVDDMTSSAPAITAVAPAATPAIVSIGGTGSTAVPTAPAVPLKQASYADGTYTGTGTSRHGNITATVVIANHKIVSAAVSDCATRYPCSDVNPLVSSVVANQTVPTSNVSGATDSSRAYKTAVSNALQKALVAV